MSAMNATRLIALPRRLVLLAAAGFALAALGGQAWAQVTCPTTSTNDFDGDGFTDAQECAGITTLGTVTPGPDGTASVVAGQRFFPRCVQGMDRLSCVDPNSKDLFVVLMPVAEGSLMSGTVPTAIADPFANQTAYGLAFTGLSGIGVTAHAVTSIEVPILSRQVADGSDQKAIVMAEDLDDTDLNTLAWCPYGKPNAASQVCVVYTRRIVKTIEDICGTGATALPILTAAGNPSDATAVFRAYTIETILHEVGHSIGGLTSKFNSSYGGYHYSPGTIMEHYVVASTTKGNCKFAISKTFNTRLDPPAVILK
jgi:hypothetical protein